MGHRVGRHGSRNRVALPYAATDVQQPLAMGDRFHALCDDRPVEGLTQADDSFQDDPIFDILKHVADKTLVDLQGRDLQPPQIGQR